MKLLRHGPKGHERPATLDAQGRVRDLSGLIGDLTPRHLSPEGLAALRAVDLQALPIVPQGRLAVPWTDMGKFIAIGLNYADHAAESNLPMPREPIVFTKATSCAVGANHDVVLPKGGQERLGGRARRRHRQQVRATCPEADALAHVAGYCVVNDVSRARVPDRARQPMGQGQGLRHLRPHRPLAGHRRRGGRPAEPGMWLDLNGQRMPDRQHQDDDLRRGQAGELRQPFMTLEPGDCITTGTPPGVGMGMKPQPGVPQGRRRHAAGHREAGRAAADGACLGPGADRRLRPCARQARTAPTRRSSASTRPTTSSSRGGSCSAVPRSPEKAPWWSRAWCRPATRWPAAPSPPVSRCGAMARSSAPPRRPSRPASMCTPTTWPSPTSSARTSLAPASCRRFMPTRRPPSKASCAPTGVWPRATTSAC
jgi:2,4-diketo-3-deoxy-L-fuconate hydrolase